MASIILKEEAAEPAAARPPGAATPPLEPRALNDLCTNSHVDSDTVSVHGNGTNGSGKRTRVSEEEIEEGRWLVKRRPKAEDGVQSFAALPLGFLDPLTPATTPAGPVIMPMPLSVVAPTTEAAIVKSCRQFWKAGDYEGRPAEDSASLSAGMDHARVHPKFLHSNATSHKWALGAFAELLDNSLDEVCNGATFVNTDVLENKKDGSKMLLVEDNGGGMEPYRMRQCMSLGYSMKSKSANTIGQYGNGFKTSTMRLGADVIVFSRSRGKGGQSPSQSVGMLSYTFLRSTGKEDIIVPMIDYERRGVIWNRMSRSPSMIWNKNLDTIIQWSPYFSEADLLDQFSSMSDQGTRIIIYNLWDDDQGQLELDFDTDIHDIQVRGVNRDEKKIQMAQQFPNSRHFLTYRHSLRSYAAILYLRLPPGFRIILRGKEIEHHDIVNDMMLKEEKIYRPQPGIDGVPKDPNMVAMVMIGFVKDAIEHLDVQGYNVYHKNRLIKPFWRVWNAAGSNGRGVIGVLEANFVEPAHDKQGFERTTVLSRLEARLIHIQKTYWSTNCDKIGYAPRRSKKSINQSEEKESSPRAPSQPSCGHSGKNKSGPVASTKKGDQKSLNGNVLKPNTKSDQSDPETAGTPNEGSQNGSGGSKVSYQKSFQKESTHQCFSSSPHSDDNGFSNSDDNGTQESHAQNGCAGNNQLVGRLHIKPTDSLCNWIGPSINASNPSVEKLIHENHVLKNRVKETSNLLNELQYEKDRNKLLNEQLEEAKRKLEESDKEQEAIIEIFSEERCRREKEEENLRNKLEAAHATIQELKEMLSANKIKLEY